MEPEMFKRARNPKNIPGIYNYCDRWCERCTFTGRCLNYDGNEKRYSEEDNNEFWEDIRKVFEETKEMLQYIAEKEGIDLDNLPPDPEFEKKSEQRRENAENHKLSKMAEQYIEIVKAWFDSNNDMLQEKENTFNQQIKIGLKQEEIEKTVKTINDSIEVIRWYKPQIYVKLMRALSNDDDLFDIEPDDEYQSDADGSAKVALLGMDRSIAAWGQLQNHLHEISDEIIDILVLLEKLRRNTETHFPKARSFVRPGFDEILPLFR